MKLDTHYMGLSLKHPIVVSASPLSESLDNIKRMEDAGAAAVVMFSLFEEQTMHEANALEHFMEHGTQSYSEALSYFPQLEDAFHVGADGYLEILRRAAAAVDIPVIASLNGITEEGWVECARHMEEAGAQGIELNLYYIPADVDLTGNMVEQQYLKVLKAVRAAVKLPVAVKLSPFFSSIAHMAKQFDEAGAGALVLFNRFYQPDFDLESLEINPSLNLSTPEEIRLPLCWIAMLYGRLGCSLAATRGVHSATEVIKYVLAGADVVMTTSALLKHGIDYLDTLLQGLCDWMEARDYESVSQMKGSMSQLNVADPGAFERANYIKVLESYKGRYTL